MTAANNSKSRAGLGQLWGLVHDTVETTGTTVPQQKDEPEEISHASALSSPAADRQGSADSESDAAKPSSLAAASNPLSANPLSAENPPVIESASSIAAIQKRAELADAASDDDLPAASLSNGGAGETGPGQTTTQTTGSRETNSTTLAALAAPEPGTAAALATPTFDPSIVQTIDTTKWTVPSANPAGMAWIPGATPGTGQLLVSDSEIDETPFFRQQNLFFLSETGAFDHAASLRAFCSEPTGVTYNPLNGHLFISDDSARKVFEVDPNNPSVLISSFSTRTIELDDVEDLVFDPVTGHLLLSEGEQSTLHPRTIVEVTTTGTVISRVQMPLAVGDPEGFTYDPVRNVFYVCGHRSDDILVLSRDGQTVLDRLTLLDHVRNVTSGVGVKPKGLVLAPSSDTTDDPSNMSLWVADYATDQFMDGQLFEIKLGGTGTQQPQPLFTTGNDTVNFAQVTAGSYLAGSQYDALGGNDTVTLPTSAAAATAAGYDPAQIFHGGDGTDNITGGGLADQINGDGGNDTINGGNANDILRGGDANDTLTGGSGTDQLFGDAGTDVLKWDSADSFDGGTGFDTLDANVASSDTIDLRGAGFANLERILTGDGTDIVTLSLGKVLAQTADRQFVADLGSGTDTLRLDLAGGWTATTTNATLGPTAVAAGISVAGMTARTFTNGTDSVTVFSNAETVELLSAPPPPPALFTAGNDTVNFAQVTAGSYLAGSQYDALGGNDTVTLPVDAAAASAAGYDPAQIFRGNAGDDIISGGNLADQINGDIGTDALTGGGGNDTLRGGDDNDTLAGGSGTDQLFGDAGHDSLKWDSADSVDGGIGFDTLDANVSTGDTIDLRGAGFSNLERILTGDGTDTVTISLSKVLAQTADHQFVADLGNAADTLNIDPAGGWTVTTTNATLGPTGVAAGISVAGMTARTFTNGTDTVTIFSNAETVQILSAPAGPLFTAGNDTVNFNQVTAGSYQAGSQYNGLAGDDAVTLPVDAAAATAAGFDPAQIFRAGEGNDIVNGGKLDDQVVGDNGDDILRGGEGNDKLDGGGWQDRLEGGDGNDILLGGGSGDTLIGGLGDDHMDGGSSVDKVDYTAAAAVSVDLLAGTATGDGNDTLVDIETVLGSAFDDSITGNTAANTLEGNNGNDTLHGGGGNDTLTGGAGIDQLFGDDGHDILKWDNADSFDGGTGFDTVDAARSTSDTIDMRGNAFLNVERIQTGSGNDTVTLSLSDVLSDTADNQFVADLGAGTDRLNVDTTGGWSATAPNSTLGPTAVAAGISVAGLTAHTFTNGADTVTIFTNAEVINAQQIA